MQCGFEYRGYVVTRTGDRFIAQEDPDEGNLRMRCRYIVGLLSAIDAIWDGLDQNTMPDWFSAWLANPVEYLEIDPVLTIELTKHYTDYTYLIPGKLLRALPAIFGRSQQPVDTNLVSTFAA